MSTNSDSGKNPPKLEKLDLFKDNQYSSPDELHKLFSESYRDVTSEFNDGLTEISPDTVKKLENERQKIFDNADIQDRDQIRTQRKFYAKHALGLAWLSFSFFIIFLLIYVFSQIFIVGLSTENLLFTNTQFSVITAAFSVNLIAAFVAICKGLFKYNE